MDSTWSLYGWFVAMNEYSYRQQTYCRATRWQIHLMVQLEVLRHDCIPQLTMGLFGHVHGHLIAGMLQEQCLFQRIHITLLNRFKLVKWQYLTRWIVAGKVQCNLPWKSLVGVF